MISIDLTGCEIVICRHAMLRANERGITPDMVEATIKGGKVTKYGKNKIKFKKKYKRFHVICVDEITGDCIKIVTVEKQ